MLVEARSSTLVAGIVLFALTAIAASPTWAQTYTAVEVPLPLLASGLSNNEQLAGTVEIVDKEQPIVTVNGDQEFLSALRNDDQAFAVGVNSVGLVAGYSCHSLYTCTGIVWNGGSPVAIKSGFFPYALNDTGDVVGYYTSDGGHLNVPTVWRGGILTPLTLTLAGQTYDGGFAVGVSSDGKVAGSLYSNTYPYTTHAVVWSGTTAQDLGANAAAHAVNNHGQVVGYSGNEAALWTNGVYTNLGSLGTFAEATGINDDGVIVGDSNVPPYYYQVAFVWINGVLRKLNDLIDASTPIDAQLEEVAAVNAAGQILVSGYSESAGAERSYVLSPVGILPTAAAPTFSLLPRAYASTQTVVLADAIPTVAIYYTLDGSTPTAQSPVYEAPIKVARTTTIKAIGMAPGYKESGVATATYPIGGLGPSSTPLNLLSVVNVQAIGSLGLKERYGLDGFGNEYASDVLGTSLVWADASFTFLVSGNAAGAADVTVQLPSGNFSELKLLGTSTRGNRDREKFIVAYTDGTVATTVQAMSDWATPQSYPGEDIALTMEHRVSKTGVFSHGPYHLYGYSLNLDPTKTVRSLTLPATRYAVFLAGAIVGQTADGQVCVHAHSNEACGPQLRR